MVALGSIILTAAHYFSVPNLFAEWVCLKLGCSLGRITSSRFGVANWNRHDRHYIVRRCTFLFACIVIHLGFFQWRFFKHK